MRQAIKVLALIIGSVLLLLGGALGYVYSQQDEIIAGGISKLNEELNAPVSVASVELDLFSGFPRIRIALNRISIKDPIRANKKLIEAEYVGLGMNLLEVINGNYVIEEISIRGGTLSLFENSKAQNWNLMNASSTENSSIQLDRAELIDLQLEYISAQDAIEFQNTVVEGFLSGRVDSTMQLTVSGSFINNTLKVDGTTYLENAAMDGSVLVNTTESSWDVATSDLEINEIEFNGTFNERGGELSTKNGELLSLTKSLPMLELDEFNIKSFISSVQWEGTYDEWQLVLSPKESAFEFEGIQVQSFSGDIAVEWGAHPLISAENIALSTNTGTLSGSAIIKGAAPVLSVQVEGGSNLSELFSFIEIETLINPMGFWSGSNLKLKQGFKSWDDFTPLGTPSFEGNMHLKEVSFGINESNILFEKIEADLDIQENLVRVDRCFIQSGPNNVIATGMVNNVIEGRPKVELRIESPTIDADPLLFWEFEDDPNDAETDFGFDFEVDLYIDNLNLGKFDGKGLRGIIYNRGNKLLGREMRIDGCGGTFRGNWALAEESGGSRFWSAASCSDIELDELLQSFDSFDIEDLDESNLKGTAKATAEMTFHFDDEWNVRSPLTKIDVQAEVRNGQLRNYAPLQELSAFIDRSELAQISFPVLKGPFQVRGDTLIVPETKVENSAINLWVNGWQNLETDEIKYSVRIGLKDLALRGKNSNRDLGNWIAEAETENQPYMRLLMGCNLEDPCLSLDRKQIQTSLKSTIKKEKEDLKSLFKREDSSEETPTPNTGSFELLWPDSDSLDVEVGL